MNIHMEQRHGDGDYWSLTFISKGFEFTEEDLTAVRSAVELSGGHERQLLPLDQYDRPGGGPSRSYRGGWDRANGLRRTNRIVVGCTKGSGLARRYGRIAFWSNATRARASQMHDIFLRQQLNEQGLNILAP